MDAFGSPIAAHAIMPPFTTSSGLTPKNAGRQSTRSASLPCSTDPTWEARPWAIAGLIAHGLASQVGSVEHGKLADLVLWRPAFFGVKPELVVKGGMIAWAAMGDPNASIPTPQPVLYRPMFGAFGRARATGAVTFVSKAALAQDVPRRLGLARRAVAVGTCRSIGKRDMIHNDALPRIEVDPETYEVRADGELLTCEPARVLPMAQRYFLF